MSQAAAGWYDQGNGTQRYWDGSQWTEHTAPSAAPAAPDLAVPPAPAPVAPPAPPAPAPEPVAAPPAPVAVPAAPMPVSASIPPPPVAVAPKKRKIWPWILGIGIFLLVGVIVLVAVIVGVVMNATAGPREAIDSFDQAWADANCQQMESVTTAAYRDATGYSDCAVFEETATSLGGATSLSVTSTEISNGVATVETVESYTGDSTKYDVVYTLVQEDGAWLIESVEYP